MTKKTKKVNRVPLFNLTDSLRVTKHDLYNISIEELVEVEKQKTKKTVQEWKTIGYYPQVSDALRAVIRKGLIADVSEVNSIEGYVKQVEDQVNYLADIVRKHYRE